MSENLDYRFEKIASVGRMKEIMTTYYIGVKTARSSGKKTAWLTSGAPVEFCVALDIIPVYPENHAAMIGASKQGTDFCLKAEEMGYSQDICSYARADIACARHGGGPIGGLGEPDVLICCNNICGTVLKWYEVQARRFNVPLFILDTPMVHQEYHEENRLYVLDQFKELIALLEKISGNRFDPERFAEVAQKSFRAQELWQKILDTSAHRPSPMSAFDAFFHLGLIVTLRGTDIVIEYYTALLAELESRIANRICAVPGERYRLLWDNLPVWHKTRWLSDTFAAKGACLVADTYTTAWCSNFSMIDHEKLLASYAQVYTAIYLNIGVDRMAENVIAMIDKYGIDGLVLHSNRSCKPYSIGQYDIQRIVQEKRGIPSLVIESDMLDGRAFTESPIVTRIEAFIEMLDKGSSL